MFTRAGGKYIICYVANILTSAWVPNTEYVAGLFLIPQLLFCVWTA